MTKLDEAIKAAAEAYFQEPCDDLDPELADSFCAAIQAAVKVLLPDTLDLGPKGDVIGGAPVTMPHYPGSERFNQCLQMIRENAGIEE